MAIVNVQDVGGCLHKCISLLDSALRVSFITDAVVNILGMRRIKNYIPLKRINIMASNARYSDNIELCSRSDIPKLCSVEHQVFGEPSPSAPQRNWKEK